MVNHSPLSQVQQERIYWGKLAGRSLSELAATVGCTLHCARKWWRLGRDRGLQGWRAARRGRSKAAVLSGFAPAVRDTAWAFQRAHPGWGAKRLLLALQTEPARQGARRPGPSRLAAFFREQCPQCVALRPRHRPPPQPAATAHPVHEQWPLHSQEGLRLHNQAVATICNIRDPLGGAMMASRAFSVGAPRRWRSLEWSEVRDV